jgi:GAF domain-containing protein
MMDSHYLPVSNRLLEMLNPSFEEAGDLEKTLQRVVAAAYEIFSPDLCTILAINPVTGQFMAPVYLGVSHQGTPQPNEFIERSFDGKALLVRNLAVQPEYQTAFTAAEGINAFAALLLYARDSKRPLARLYLDFRQAHDFSAEEQGLLELLADYSSLILHELWLLRRGREVIRIGHTINEKLGTVDALFRELQVSLEGVLDISHVFVLVACHTLSGRVDIYLGEKDTVTVFLDQPPAAVYQWVIKEQHPLMIRHLSDERARLPLSPLDGPGTIAGMESQILVPLTFQGMPLGVLSIQHPHPYVYTQEDCSLLEWLADFVSVALSNLDMYNNLSKLSTVGDVIARKMDAQPGLQAIGNQIQIATGADLSVLFLDNQSHQRLSLPYIISGNFLEGTSQQLGDVYLDTKALFQTQEREAYFAQEISAESKWGVADSAKLLSFVRTEQIRSIAVTRFRLGNQQVGYLLVCFRQAQPFALSQRVLILGLAHYAAIAIEHLRTYSALMQRRIEELELLRSIELQIASTLDLETILRTILEGATAHISAAFKGAILLYDKRSRTLETQASITRDPPYQTPLSIPIHEGKGITRWVFEHKRSARVDNVQEDLPWRDIYLEGDSLIRSELDVPLMDGEEVVGIINFESRQEAAFSQQDQDFLETLAGQTVLAIKNSRAHGALMQRRLGELEVLRRIDLQINQTIDLKTVLSNILEGAATHVPTAYKGSIFLYNPATDSLETQAFISSDPSYRQTLVIPLSQEKGIIRWAFEHKRSARVDNVLSDPQWSDLYLPVAENIHSELDVPLIDGEEVVGIINFESRQEAAFSQQDQDFLETLAGQAVLAIKNAQLYESLKRVVEDQQTLIEIIERITNQDDTERIYEPILEKALRSTDSPVGILMLYDAQQDDLYIAAQLGIPTPAERRQRLDEGLIGWVARNKELLNVGDVTQAEWEGIYFGFVPGIHSELAVPILEGQELRGVINVEHTQVNHYTRGHEVLIKALADLVLIVIQKVKAIQRLKDAEALSSVGNMRFELAHRLGNDLGRIKSYVNIIQKELITRQIQSPVVSKNLDRIVYDVGRVLNLAEAFRSSFAELVRTRTQPKALINLRDIMLAWVSKLKSELPSNIRLQYEIAENVAPVYGVSQQIQVVLEHLILNAQQAMEQHGGILTLRARNTSSSVEIQIQDTGGGIPKERQGRIFEPFYTTKNSSGFGLYIALSYAHDNGGELKVDSSPGRGTIFTLLLPIAQYPDGGLS